MVTRRTSKKSSSTKAKKPGKTADLKSLLVKEKEARRADSTRLEREIDDLRNLLLKTQQSKSSLEMELEKRLKRLKFQFEKATRQLALSNHKASSLWIEKVSLQEKVLDSTRKNRAKLIALIVILIVTLIATTSFRLLR